MRKKGVTGVVFMVIVTGLLLFGCGGGGSGSGGGSSPSSPSGTVEGNAK